MESKIKETLIKYGYEENCVITSYSGFVADYAKENNCTYLVRGLRNQTDYAYEEEMAICNSVINPNVKTIYVRAENSEISSSLVYAMLQSGKDVSKFLPYELDLNQTNKITDTNISLKNRTINLDELESMIEALAQKENQDTKYFAEKIIGLIYSHSE